MIIDEDKFDGEWHDFDGEVKFNIIPYDFSMLNVEDEISNIVKHRFMYCLIDWKGLVNKEGSVFEYNEDNKEALYNYYDDIREFIFLKSNLSKKEN